MKWNSRSRLGAIAPAIVLALILSPVAALAKKPPGGPPVTGDSNAFSGRAYALDATLTVLQILGGGATVHVGPVSDTGELPPTGGMLNESLVTLHTPPPLAIDLGLLNAGVMGSGDRSVAFASVADLDIDLAGALHISAGVLQSTAIAKCVRGSQSSSGHSEILELVIEGGGKTLKVDAAAPPNTHLDIDDLAEIIVNEQYTDQNGRFVVNALHVKVGGPLSPLATADVIVSHAEAGIACGGGDGGGGGECPVKDFVTGGGWITLDGGAKGTFGMVGGQKPNGLQGNISYHDHGDGTFIKGKGVTAYTGTGTERTITYTCTVNGQNDTCVVDVADNGEPGGGVDEFSIDSGAYDASGPKITKGNIQLHKPDCGSGGKGKPRR